MILAAHAYLTGSGALLAFHRLSCLRRCIRPLFGSQHPAGTCRFLRVRLLLMVSLFAVAHYVLNPVAAGAEILPLFMGETRGLKGQARVVAVLGGVR